MLPSRVFKIQKITKPFVEIEIDPQKTIQNCKKLSWRGLYDILVRFPPAVVLDIVY